MTNFLSIVKKIIKNYCFVVKNILKSYKELNFYGWNNSYNY